MINRKTLLKIAIASLILIGLGLSAIGLFGPIIEPGVLEPGVNTKDKVLHKKVEEIVLVKNSRLVPKKEIGAKLQFCLENNQFVSILNAKRIEKETFYEVECRISKALERLHQENTDAEV